MNKLIISFLKSLIVIISVSLIFSNTTSNLDTALSETFSDIYKFSSDAAKSKIIPVLEKSCDVFTGKSDAISATEICNNQTLLESLKTNCAEYRRLKREGVDIKNEASVMESCDKIESGELERECKTLNSRNIELDKDKLKEVCNSYSSGKIDDSEFFTSMITQTIGDPQQSLNTPLLQKYNQFIEIFQNLRLVLFAVIVVLFVLILLLLKDIKQFLLIVGKISFSISLTIFLPYISVLAYDNFIGIDASPVLDGLTSGESSLDPKILLSLATIMILSIYDRSMITIGIILLAIGIAGKVFGLFSKKNSEAKKS